MFYKMFFPSIYYVIEYKTDFSSQKYCLIFIFICIFGDLLIEKSFGNSNQAISV